MICLIQKLFKVADAFGYRDHVSHRVRAIAQLVIVQQYVNMQQVPSPHLKLVATPPTRTQLVPRKTNSAQGQSAPVNTNLCFHNENIKPLCLVIPNYLKQDQ